MPLQNIINIIDSLENETTDVDCTKPSAFGQGLDICASEFVGHRQSEDEKSYRAGWLFEVRHLHHSTDVRKRDLSCDRNMECERFRGESGT
jgi:hypothetical protein